MKKLEIKESGNHVIRKSGNDKRLFEEKRTNLKYKKRNTVYTIHGEDYKMKSNLNPHTKFVLDVSPRRVMLDLLCYHSFP